MAKVKGKQQIKVGKMKASGRGFEPPRGPGGGHGKGEFSMDRNPMFIPAKGSMLKNAGELGKVVNADRQKSDAMRMAQEKNENLRGR